MVYTSKAFWLETVERMIRTFAQALIGALGTGALGILDVDWAGALSIAAMATLLALLTAVATPEKMAADGENSRLLGGDGAVLDADEAAQIGDLSWLPNVPEDDYQARYALEDEG